MVTQLVVVEPEFKPKSIESRIRALNFDAVS